MPGAAPPQPPANTLDKSTFVKHKQIIRNFVSTIHNSSSIELIVDLRISDPRLVFLNDWGV